MTIKTPVHTYKTILTIKILGNLVLNVVMHSVKDGEHISDNERYVRLGQMHKFPSAFYA